RQTKLPVFGLTGFFDPIVPWPRVRRWLRKNCPALREYKVIMRADHNVLNTAPKEAAKQVLRWIDDLRPLQNVCGDAPSPGAFNFPTVLASRPKRRGVASTLLQRSRFMIYDL
ncbi:MAG: hypothetical protein ACLPRE_04075, partial [Limisphaerales bacterium]